MNQVETDRMHSEKGNAEGACIDAFRRQLFVCAGLILVVALSIFFFGSPVNDWAIVASMGMGLVACSVLVLAFAA